jgi:antitoxin component of MazEF toxin-antitoxin module
MRALQKLVRNGNSTHIAIPIGVLHWLGWLPGEAVILETLEDKSILVHRPGPNDFLPKRHKAVVLDPELPLTP